jgi:hypothetical protein
MLYFATVSFAEVTQRMSKDGCVAWRGFLGVGDDVLGPLPRQSFDRLRDITHGRGDAGSPQDRAGFVDWLARAIEPRNIAGLADARRRNLYPVDLDALVERHALIGMSREQVVAALPALRGMAPEHRFV